MNKVNKILAEVNYVQTGDNEFHPAVLFSEEVVRADWLGTPIAWTYQDGKWPEKDFETIEELVEFLKTLEEENK